MKPASTELLAYLAGLFDGEGSISLYFWRGRTYVCVKLANTDAGVVGLLQEYFGGKVRRQEPYGLGKKVQYHWRARVPETKEFLVAIQPWLRIKRKQADVMIQFLETRDSGCLDLMIRAKAAA